MVLALELTASALLGAIGVVASCGTEEVDRLSHLPEAALEAALLLEALGTLLPALLKLALVPLDLAELLFDDLVLFLAKRF